MCASWGAVQFLHAMRFGAVAFQLARRERVLLRDILRFGTAIGCVSSNRVLVVVLIVTVVRVVLVLRVSPGGAGHSLVLVGQPEPRSFNTAQRGSLAS